MISLGVLLFIHQATIIIYSPKLHSSKVNEISHSRLMKEKSMKKSVTLGTLICGVQRLGDAYFTASNVDL
jgi:hypothetical protein